MAADPGYIDQSFRAFGSQCRILLFAGSDELCFDLRYRLHQLECDWSRFRDDSEVSVLNRSTGPVIVGDDTLYLIVHAVEAWRLTAGLFDPLMLDNLVELGYDRDHRELELSSGDISSVSSRVRRSPMVDLVVDEPLHSVTLPAGHHFDPGGIGKGLAADIITDTAVAAGVDGVLVDLGGDIRMEGNWCGSSSWPASVADPVDPEASVASIDVEGGAMATSGTRRRRWSHDGKVHHHLLDPRTGFPSVSDLTAVTVHANMTWYAEAVAKACLIGGRDAAVDLIQSKNIGAVLFGVDDTAEYFGSLSAGALSK